MSNNEKIKSVDQYIKTIIDKTANSENDDELKFFWFRGESSIKWTTPLVPSSYRVLAETFKNKIDDLFISDNIKVIEQNISAEFYRKALPYISTKGIENTSWNRYFLMQHYKINTRLLDWTENAILALFFAIFDNSKIEDDAKVWILQPLNLNNFTIKTILNSEKSCWVIPTGGDSEIPQNLISDSGKLQINELTRRYLRMDFKHEETEVKEIYHPLAVYPSFLDERMTSQKACFTIFGNKINGLLTSNNSAFIDSVTISGGKSKNEMLKQLRLLGIDFESIFPDLDGLGQSIQSKYKNKFLDNRETLIHVIQDINNKMKK